MAEIKVGQKYTRVGVWSVQKDHETYCVVTGVSGDRVKYTYDSGRSDYSSVVSFYPSFQDYGDSYQGAAFVLVEDVEELEPLKLEHLKAGQLVIRKRDDWQRFITKVNGDEIEYLCGYKGDNLTIEMDAQAKEFLDYCRLPDISEVAQFKKDNPDLFAEYVMPEEPVADAISPSVYQFPNGVEVRDISAHLTSFGGQAVQYIARSTRLDGVVKGLPIQDLKKAIQLLEWEVDRLEEQK